MFEHLTEAIEKRYSERKYDVNFKLTDDQKEQLTELINRMAGCESAIKIHLLENDNKKLFKGVVFSYGKTNAPYMLVFVGKKGDVDTAFKVGYLGELLALEATAAGLQTCFIGGTYENSEVLSRITIDTDEAIYVTMALGKAERVKEVPAHKRKCVEDITAFVPRKSEAWIYTALEAASLAPSSMNRQPARFKIDIDQHIIAFPVKQTVENYLDLGIAAANFQVSAAAHGHAGKWLRCDQQYYFSTKK